MQASIYFNPQNQRGRSLFSKINSGCGFIGQAHRNNASRSSYWDSNPEMRVGMPRYKLPGFKHAKSMLRLKREEIIARLL
jgi:hypothetical protein